jgi:hypothetical protein
MAASGFADDNDPESEGKRHSLLDAIEDRNRRLNKVLFTDDKLR